MSGYIDTAFSYDESDLGLDPETKLRFKPNKKELELFKLEKLNMPKGNMDGVRMSDCVQGIEPFKCKGKGH